MNALEKSSETKLSPRQRMALRLQLEVEQLSETDYAKLISGDVGMLSKEVQAAYLNFWCERLGVDPLTQPIILITTDGKTRIYARKECAEQIGANQKVNVELLKEGIEGEVYKVILKFRMPDGRENVNIGSAYVGGTVRGDGIAKAFKVAWSQAERRGILAITGFGLSDEGDAKVQTEAPRRYSLPSAEQAVRDFRRSGGPLDPIQLAAGTNQDDVLDAETDL